MTRSPRVAMSPKDGRPILTFDSQRAFRAWLKKNAGICEGIWIKFAKKGSEIVSVTYPEAVDVALCYGWIDSQVARLDEKFYLQRFTPRGRRSVWSKINCGKVARLIESGEMTAQGMKQVDAARADGRWDRAYEGPGNMMAPADFRKQLDKSARAKKFFEKLTAAYRFAILYRIQDAKRPETRVRRIEQFIAMLKQGKTIH